jgi:hypothetical protein
VIPELEENQDIIIPIMCRRYTIIEQYYIKDVPVGVRLLNLDGQNDERLAKFIVCGTVIGKCSLTKIEEFCKSKKVVEYIDLNRWWPQSAVVFDEALEQAIQAYAPQLAEFMTKK